MPRTLAVVEHSYESTPIYVLLPDGMDIATANSKIEALIADHKTAEFPDPADLEAKLTDAGFEELAWFTVEGAN